jgi:CHAT domain-containing protein/Tfp pilus assembly protein PilF
LEKELGSDHPEVAHAIDTLAEIYLGQGRYAEAESLAKRSLTIYEKILLTNKPEKEIPAMQLCSVGSALKILADIYLKQGRYAEAEAALKRALILVDKAKKLPSLDGSEILSSLALIYNVQGRYEEAEPLFQQALAVCKNDRGEHLCKHEYLLADLYIKQNRFKDAETIYQRWYEVRKKEFGLENWHLGKQLNDLAVLYEKQGKYAEAEQYCAKSLAILEKSSDPENPDFVDSLHTLARVYYEQNQLIKAEPYVDQVITITDRAAFSPRNRYDAYLLRARIAWKEDRRSEAFSDLRQAMDLAEQLRSQAAGTELERASFFAKFTEAFEQMVAWQIEQGDMSEALDAIERGKARSLLDEMIQSGADLELSRPALEREQLRNREAELNQHIARIEQQLEKIPAINTNSQEPISLGRKQLEADLSKTRSALYEHYRDQRSSSPVYRQLLSAGSSPPRLSQIQRRLMGKDNLLLSYLLGDEGGYLLAATTDKARLTALIVEETDAKLLGIEPGPLTGKRLAEILVNEKGDGVLQRLRDQDKSDEAAAKLVVLWRVLIPETHRADLAEGKIKRLIIIPDGKLSLLPFEALVVKPGKSPKYLLDVGPAIIYGPSATVLYNLADRPVAEHSGNQEPVLTVGNPAYGGKAEQLVSNNANEVLSVNSRYHALGGKLAPLPYSGWESNWVAEIFNKAGMKSVSLQGIEATKSKVLSIVEGRKIIHLACHGLADQAYGNFFGALAFAPGANRNEPGGNGFLTLSEIYGLNLKDTELTILSACDTNYGPQQRGEGVWALSRGFIVAGSRRVVASNWLVDDEAGATLISYFCTHLTNDKSQTAQADYAEALLKAKRDIRNNEKWKGPYYWATFVLVGPN